MPAPGTLSLEKRTELKNLYRGLPMSFEPNQGQTDASVKFVTRGDRYSMFFRPTDVVFSLRNSPPGSATPTNAIMRLKLLNAKQTSPISGQDPLAARTNYFIGNNPAKHHSNVANFRSIRYEQIYDGIDLVYYGNQNQLEYDFVVAPGASSDTIRMAFQGIDKAEIDAQGNLALRIGDNYLVQHKPVIYQNSGGKRLPVAGGYELLAANNKSEAVVGFKVEQYDRSLPLVIDPELVYATFFGDRPNVARALSDHSGDDEGFAIAIDPSGAAYVVGTTSSYEFPLAGALLIVDDAIDHAGNPFYAHVIPGAYRGFITKFTPDAKALVYSTYLSSATGDTEVDPNSTAITVPALFKQERCTGVAVDGLGNAYICGFTDYASYPIKNALHAYSGNRDAFLTKVNALGTDLLFSTYLGGEGSDEATDIAIDNAGSVVVVGRTNSTRFVLAHALQSTYGGGASDGFISKFTADGAVNTFSTYIGGAGNDGVNGVATDSSGNIFIAGFTTSTNFPVANPLQPIKNANTDAFVSKLNSSGSLLVFSTYFGGNGDDFGNGVAVDSAGHVYVTGATFSTDFPTISPTILPAQGANGGPAGTSDAFVSKFSVFGTSLIFSTYLGGNMNDVGLRVRVDSRNAIYVCGTTALAPGGLAINNSFPTEPQQNTLQTGMAGKINGFLAKYNPTGTPLVFSTYIGGSSTHKFYTENHANGNLPNPFGDVVDTSVVIRGLAVDNIGNAYLTGSTDGDFYFTFGSYSTLGATNALPGEDYPAPATDIIQNTADPTKFIRLPSESQPIIGQEVDDHDVVIAKIADNSPLITSPASSLGSLAKNFGYTITATNNPSAFNAAGLPPGLSVNTASGQIAGIPTLEGNYSVVLTATNASGTGAQILFINISSAKPNITNGLTATGNVGSVFQFQLSADNNPGTFTLTPALPVGLSLDANTGLISGVPVVEGIYSFTEVASNLNGSSAPQPLTINVLPAIPVISSAVNVQAVLNAPFVYTITATGNAQVYGVTPVDMTGPQLLPPLVKLPIGLQLNTSNGIISGTPNALGFYSFTVSATNGGGTGTQQLLLTVIPPLVPIISSSDVASGITNELFNYTIIANNSPLSYGVVGTLPPGLSLNDQTGVISGVPVVPTIAVTTKASATTTATLTTAAAHGLNVGDTVIVALSPPDGTSANGFDGVWTVATVPDATTITYTKTVDSTLATTPTAGVVSAGVFVITQTATNAAGTGSKTLTITIFPPAVPVISSPLSSAAQINAPYQYDIKATNHPTGFDATGLPTGLAVDNTTGRITGAPTQTGTFAVTLTATNPGGSGTATLTLTVAPQPAPVITSPNQANGFVGIPFTYQITGTNNPTTFTAAPLPANLSVSNSGLITGTPQVAGTTLVNLSATNPAGTGNKTLTLTVTQASAPTFTSPLPLVTGLDGAAFTYTITASGIGPINFSATPLPQGLSLVGDTIIGHPVGGTTVVTLTAYSPATNPTFPGGPPNPLGVAPTTALLTIQISPTPAGIINSDLNATGTVGLPFQYDITTTGTTPITLTTSPLPSGLVLIGNSIQGTPTPAAVTLNGPFAVTLTVTNPYSDPNNPVTSTLFITINAAVPKFTSPAFVKGMDGVFFRYVIQATGTQVITYTAPSLPPGLSLSGSVISGTPTSLAVGLTTVPVTATNKGGSAVLNLGIQIDPAPPVITSPTTVTGAAGAPFTFNILATGSPQITFTLAPNANIPPGLFLDGDKITGIPTLPGVYPLIVSANNPGGTDNKPLTITINPAPPTITAAQVSGNDGIPLTYQVIVTGATPIAFSAAGLPTGLKIDATTGIISGTPSGTGTFASIINASNAGGTSSQALIFTISPSAPHIISPLIVQASPGVPFSYTITASGTPTITFQAFNLPAGLSINGAVISGTPTGPLGTTVVGLVATNAVGSDSQSLDIVLQQSPPHITNPTLQASGQEGVPFSFALTFTGSAPITFTATNLPPGLSIAPSTGVISGTPTLVGTYNVPITATNPYGSDVGKTLFITISKAPPVITSGLTIDAGFGEAINYQITVTGSTPVTFSAANLPAGLTLNAQTGLITGTPTVLGKQIASITATNSAGSDTKTLVITVFANPPIITSPLSATASTSQGFSYTITATGQPPITFTATGLPPGMTFSGNTISGIATAQGVFQVTLTATSPVGTDTQTLTITVTDDADGDSVPDDLETFLGTNPNNPASTPFVGGVATVRVLNVQTLAVKLNFKSPGNDSITAKGTLALDAGFSAAGKPVVLFIAGIGANLTFSSATKASGGLNSFALKGKPKGGSIGYNFTMKKGSFAAKLAAIGMTNENVLVPRTVTVPIFVFLNNVLYKSEKIVAYKAKAGKTGAAK